MQILNKSLLTNLFALLLLGIGYALHNPLLHAIGLFAFSGAITNWLAIYMLFERIPGLYGTGIIPLHFEAFKKGIHELIMLQFFTPENLERFVSFEQFQPNWKAQL